MPVTFKKGLYLVALFVVTGLVGCTTQAPFILSFTGLPASMNPGDTASLSATGGPGSSAGLWTWTFTSSCGGTFLNQNPVGPTNSTTVTVTFDSTGATPGPCTITVTLTTASGRTASSTQTTTITTALLPVGFYYFKGATGASDSILRLGAAGFNAGVSPNSTCATTFPGEIACDDDSGFSYTDYGGFMSSGLNSIVSEGITGTEELVVHGWNGWAMSCSPALPGTTGCGLFRHNPGTSLPESSDPQALPPIPSCTSPLTDAGTFGAGVKQVFPVGPTDPTAFYVSGSLSASDTSDTYTFSATAGDQIFVALDSGPGNDYDLYLSGPPGAISVLDRQIEAIATPIPTTGTYTVVVSLFSGSGGYKLTVCKA